MSIQQFEQQFMRRFSPRQTWSLLNGLWLVALLAFPGLLASNGISAQEPAPNDPIALLRESLATPMAAVDVLHNFPDDLSNEQLAQLRSIYESLEKAKHEGGQDKGREEIARQILAVLALSGDDSSLDYLHQLFEQAPSQRQDIAAALSRFALAKRRRVEDWRLLVRSLPFLQGPPAREVLRALREFRQRATKAELQRQVILLGIELGDQGEEALKLLEHWTGQRLGADKPTKEALAMWQTWFAKAYPDSPPAERPVDPDGAKYPFKGLLAKLRSEELAGDPKAGAAVLEKAQCLKCHRYGQRGEAMGPDLTNAARRFQAKQLLQEILFPSFAIPEEYASQTLLTKDGRSFTGLVAAARGGRVVILQANGDKAEVSRAEIDELIPSRQSSMPTGLLDSLSLQEIADLFAFLLNSESHE